jgi:hypothetical protein
LGVAGIAVLLESDHHGFNPKADVEAVMIVVEFAILN